MTGDTHYANQKCCGYCAGSGRDRNGEPCAVCDGSGVPGVFRKPVRLKLSRRKDFDLQALSRATNGLPALNVARPGKLGNMFVVTPDRPARKIGNGPFSALFAVPTVEEAVACFREVFSCEGETGDGLRAELPKVRGHNVACWCGLKDLCHGDVWLELANAGRAP